MNNPIPSPAPTHLNHGGRLRQAAADYSIPLEHWIDLSTGISPWSWPVPPLPEDIWRRLPEDDDGLLSAAANYYGCHPSRLLAVPGSQWAISQLPQLLAQGTVALPYWGYQEHAHRWQRAGHRPVFYRTAEQLHALVASTRVNYAVAINPNNPSGDMLNPDLLRELADLLHQRHGLLVVDEAFMDSTPQFSLAGSAAPGLVVLRSLGKFFGLAGVRLGFAIADPQLIACLRDPLDPWAVSHPARWVGSAALADGPWQQQQRQRLAAVSQQWREILHRHLPDWPLTGCDLFTTATATVDQCKNLLHRCASAALLVRLITADGETARIRFGLPAEWQLVEAEQRLAQAIRK